MSLLERFQLINDIGEFEKLGSHPDASTDEEQGSFSTEEKEAQRYWKTFLWYLKKILKNHGRINLNADYLFSAFFFLCQSLKFILPAKDMVDLLEYSVISEWMSSSYCISDSNKPQAPLAIIGYS